MKRPVGEDMEEECTEALQRMERLVGLARKARALTIGLRATERIAQRQKCRLVLLAEDASPRTSRIVRTIIEKRLVLIIKDKRTLGSWAGSSPVAVLGITNSELARAIHATAPHAPHCLPADES